MKTIPIALISAALMLSLANSALAQQKMDKMPGMDKNKMGTTVPAAGYPAVGVVKHVDAAAGQVTIAHGPIKGLDWPAMTMTFMVKNKMLFDKLTVDKKVDFQVSKQGSDYVVVGVK